jgi:hypothetical protein
MNQTTNHYVYHAITIRLHTMAVEGVGRSKSLVIANRDRRGQFCARTREIR